MEKDWSKFKLIVADLDGTLSKSKQPMDPEMSELIRELLKYKAFAVISGGSYNQFKNQFVSNLGSASQLSNLYLFPTCATSMYLMKGNAWEKIYGDNLSDKTKQEILAAFDRALPESGFEKPATVYGEMIEDRETQLTFSATGQQAPLDVKSAWDPDGSRRQKIIKYLMKYLPPGLEAKIGGTNSIDVTKEGINKAYGIHKIEEKLGYKISEMFFIGDRLYEGGNDYPVKTTGVECMEVKDPEETKKIFKEIINSSK